MHTNKNIRNIIKNGGNSVGTWIQLPSPESAEIIANLGYDWAAVDLEHGAISRNNLPGIFCALERFGVVPFARVIEARPSVIKEALDAGARGLILPMISTLEQLDIAIRSAFYPGGSEYCLGQRGVGFSRANLFGKDFKKYYEESQDIVIVAQIEHIDAIDNLDEIFAHPRLDAYMIGPYDLSASMGLTGNFNDPKFIKAVDTIQTKAKQFNIAAGYHIVEPNKDNLKQAILNGYNLIAYGIDTLFLQSGIRPQFEDI